ncbi:hypothetical protein [Chondromyces apiculatus]|uniref:hypothetical protein n=1 Tax=Chondromyces apiculatus TaxID=51 RepID=UPI0012DF3F1C|nr:hypothetical protein [Chondromyces apiculatus]
MKKHVEEIIDNPYAADPEPVPLSVRAAEAALSWFEQADKQALAKDPPSPRWLKATRIPTIGIMGPGLPEGAGSIRVTDTAQRQEAWRNQPGRVQKWIASAKRDFAAGQPAAAFTFGLDLHWIDDDALRDEGLELLVMAYEKLGRHAHAETLKVHCAHRDLGSVGVFLSAGEEPSEEAGGA